MYCDGAHLLPAYASHIIIIFAFTLKSLVSGQLFRLEKMGGLFSYFRGLLGSREMRILILGLDGAGECTVYTVWNGINLTSYEFDIVLLDSRVADPDPTFH
jgi:hypothetical protein